MNGDPTHYLFLDAEDCCQFHFKWSLQNCRKTSFDDPKYYPDFDMGGCKNDGQEPIYMKRYSDYHFDTAQECCEYHFPWNVEACASPDPPEDPCASEVIFSNYREGYNEDFLTEDEFAWYPSCE